MGYPISTGGPTPFWLKVRGGGGVGTGDAGRGPQPRLSFRTFLLRNTLLMSPSDPRASPPSAVVAAVPPHRRRPRDRPHMLVGPNGGQAPFYRVPSTGQDELGQLFHCFMISGALVFARSMIATTRPFDQSTTEAVAARAMKALRCGPASTILSPYLFTPLADGTGGMVRLLKEISRPGP